MALVLSNEAEYSVVCKRNASLPPAARRWVFSSIAVLILGIAGGFAAAGAWPIAPFAGLELAILFLAFREMARHEGDCETIVIAGDMVKVETVRAGSRQQMQFNRHWVQVVVESGSALAVPRVWLRSHGRLVEVGRHLSEERRLALARELKLRLTKR
jgi:uncharacterized membrane protein